MRLLLLLYERHPHAPGPAVGPGLLLLLSLHRGGDHPDGGPVVVAVVERGRLPILLLLLALLLHVGVGDGGERRVAGGRADRGRGGANVQLWIFF